MRSFCWMKRDAFRTGTQEQKTSRATRQKKSLGKVSNSSIRMRIVNGGFHSYFSNRLRKLEGHRTRAGACEKTVPNSGEASCSPRYTLKMVTSSVFRKLHVILPSGKWPKTSFSRQI